jgi:serine/threonine protein kinase
MHQKNVVHRDIKPENLMLDPTGAIVLVDLSLARKTAEGDQVWTACGTPGYVSPEVIKSTLVCTYRTHDPDPFLSELYNF